MTKEEFKITVFGKIFLPKISKNTPRAATPMGGEGESTSLLSYVAANAIKKSYSSVMEHFHSKALSLPVRAKLSVIEEKFDHVMDD